MGANYPCSGKRSLCPKKIQPPTAPRSQCPAGESLGNSCEAYRFPRGGTPPRAQLPTGTTRAQAVPRPGALLSAGLPGAAPGRPPGAGDPGKRRHPPVSPLEGATNPALGAGGGRAPARVSPALGSVCPPLCAPGAASRGRGPGSSQPRPLHLSAGAKGLCWGGGGAAQLTCCAVVPRIPLVLGGEAEESSSCSTA